MPHRDFELKPSSADPPTFNVAGHEFKCLADPPAGVLMDLFALAEGSLSVKAAGVIQFIGGCLTDPAEEEFRALVYDKDTVVPLETLVDIGEWLIEAYTTRPTTPSSGSEPGSTATPATSEGGADSPVLTSVEPA